MSKNHRFFCWRRVVLAIVTNLLTGSATVGTHGGALLACVPVALYSREFQAQATEELVMLPDGSAAMEMLSNYVAMREQAWV